MLGYGYPAIILEELIQNLQKQVGDLAITVKQWEDSKASSKERVMRREKLRPI